WFTTEEIESGKNFDDKDQNALGFHVPGRWDKVINIEKCYLQEDPSNQIRNQIRDFAIAHQLPFFDLREQKGLLRNLMIRTASTGEIMVLIQFFYDDMEQIKLLMDYVAESFPEITSLLYVVNSKGNDTIYDQKVICYKGRDHIFEEMEGLRFKID